MLARVPHLSALSLATLAVLVTSACGDPAGAAGLVHDASDSSDAADAADPLPQDAADDTVAPHDAPADAQLDAPPADADPDAEESGADASPPVPDPAVDGPYTYKEIDAFAGLVGVHCAIPEQGPAPAPFPLVLLAHGFLIEPFRYYDYVKRLASFGHIACTVAYSSFSSQDNDPQTIIEVLDWALSENEGDGALSGKIDGSRIGVMGHSRGGKAAVNAAAQDARFKAVLGLDPVNTCPMGTCPDGITAMASVHVPSAFVGETTDDGSDGGEGDPCAPAEDNFQQFYAAAPSQSLMVHVLGANHMSFVVDDTGCLQCSLCQEPSLDRETVLELAYAYSIAFFERHLRDLAGYETYLTGAEAQQRYVQTGLVSIASK